MPRTSTGRIVDVGNIVKVVAVPPDLDRMPKDMQIAFRAIVGHRFKVRSVHPEAKVLELDVSRIVDPLLGSFLNSVWIEPECVA
ncbi:MAG: hypothetical protein AB1898_31200 [Acidobacteriota bacterium]